MMFYLEVGAIVDGLGSLCGRMQLLSVNLVTVPFKKQVTGVKCSRESLQNNGLIL